jgi:hypothetical protein
MYPLFAVILVPSLHLFVNPSHLLDTVLQFLLCSQRRSLWKKAGFPLVQVALWTTFCVEFSQECRNTGMIQWWQIVGCVLTAETGSTRERRAHGYIPNATHGLSQVRNVSIGLSIPMPSAMDLPVDSETNFRMYTKRDKLCCETSVLVGHLLPGASWVSQSASEVSQYSRRSGDIKLHHCGSLQIYEQWLLCFVALIWCILYEISEHLHGGKHKIKPWPKPVGTSGASIRKSNPYAPYMAHALLLITCYMRSSCGLF